MSNLSKIDKNFEIKTSIQKEGLRFFDPRKEPFSLHGLFYRDGSFRRMPEEVARATSRGVLELHTFTSGGRIRFRTNSSYVAIHAKMPIIGRMSHDAMSGSSGFDLYVNNRYRATFMPPYDMKDGYESLVDLGTEETREILIHFPTYSTVSELYIGLDENAMIEAPTPYEVTPPIVFYGSSITQGGCASRPGTAYDAVVSRRVGADYVNLGFSGNAKGEDAIANYIKDLPMSAFVYDYDHNAPSAEHLVATHEKMFRTIREANPTLPILILQMPVFRQNEEIAARFAVIAATYENARAAGDENVYLIDGKTLMALAEDDGTVDGCHPNDLGFASMAKAVGEVLEKILN